MNRALATTGASTSVLTSVGNLMTSTSGGTSAAIGVAFTPTHQYTADAASTIQSTVQSGAGLHQSHPNCGAAHRRELLQRQGSA